ncbi:DUF3747 domain-containing protein [Synechococcus sp. RSCCF101]|uniref:DUF3747 domain-containing protein n=1 Tax=Synechococcus sp. RSCCF101 TaxID=2511069 RepID=UPI001244B581|nr:DUF3747 domain-containing protein [Synechococcus sp. RSCCF101]QEY32802.1 DUF3747 domain-containing protein [Synechococcus sp. RSCCF101]
MALSIQAGRRRWRSALAVGALGLASVATIRHQARAAAVFDGQPVQSDRFTVLARPLSQGQWTLLVLEQLKARPACWSQRPDGLVDPSLNRFDFKGICSRYLDSNAYSLRLGDEDLGSRYRLKLVAGPRELELRAMSPSQSETILVARAPRPATPDKDAFVQLELEPEWALERRSYQGKALGHLYFAHDEALPVLLSRASGSRPGGATGLAAPGPVQLTSGLRTTRLSGAARRSGPIALEVIPYRR